MQIFEDSPGYKVTATSVEITYNVIEADGLDYWTVRAGVLAFAPQSNAPPGAQYAWPRRGLGLNEVAPGVWKATITWASLTYQYALKIGGSNQQVRCDKALSAAFNAPGFASPWSAGAKGVPVGFDGKSVHGTSIHVPSRSWTESVEIPISDYTFDYEDQVATLKETPVNLKSFRGFDEGEVKFLGMNAQLSTQNPDFVSATFEFEQQWNNSAANNNLLTIGGITGIAKKGWEFVDVVYAPVSTDNLAGGAGLPNPCMVPVPAYVLIHRMYDEGDFKVLNIGTDESLPLWQGPVKS